MIPYLIKIKKYLDEINKNPLTLNGLDSIDTAQHSQDLIQQQSSILKSIYHNQKFGKINSIYKSSETRDSFVKLNKIAENDLEEHGRITNGKVESILWEGTEEQVSFFYKTFFQQKKPVLLKNFLKETIDFSSFTREFEDARIYLTDINSFKNRIDRLGSMKNDYIHNCESIWNFGSSGEKLRSLIDLDLCQRMTRESIGSAQFFIGKTITGGTDFHCANNHNLFFQFTGKKRWYFVNPAETAFIYPMSSRSKGHFSSFLDLADYSGSRNIKDYPLLKYLNIQTIEIEEGDALYNPPWWWHAVECLTEETISVSSRWGKLALTSFFEHNDSNIIYTLLQMQNPILWGVLLYGKLSGKSKQHNFTTPVRSNGLTLFENISHENESKSGESLSEKEKHYYLCWEK